ncbi:hypothetical protein [Mesorhizobium sp. M1403]|uniref:P-loop ATPase, Sll1717 family n=1 Tax=Mesorhizobium sp. M1403 TaxID=2957097 RepID=UPI003336E941
MVPAFDGGDDFVGVSGPREGFAIGLQKPTRLIRSSHMDFAPVRAIGLLDTLGYDGYNYDHVLEQILAKPDETTRWAELAKNKDQPVFILQPPVPTDSTLRATSAFKKIARIKFRNFNSSEISRLTASEAYEQVVSSFGVIAFLEGDSEEALRNNQRAAFIYGIARGRNIPALLITHQKSTLPLDLRDQAARWWRLGDLDKIISDFRLLGADLQNEFVSIKPHHEKLLQSLSCGDPVAENEASSLADYFLETDAYQRTLAGEANVLVGRKGSGKTAVFLQVRDRTRAHKENIFIDLIPDGYQLIKMKEFILDKLSFGTRKEVVAAFWEYVLWLEIAYKLLEKDETRVLRDTRLLENYKKLKLLFEARIDDGLVAFNRPWPDEPRSPAQALSSRPFGTRWRGGMERSAGDYGGCRAYPSNGSTAPIDGPSAFVSFIGLEEAAARTTKKPAAGGGAAGLIWTTAFGRNKCRP